MTLSMRRIVLFTKDMPSMTAFYRDVLGLKVTLQKVAELRACTAAAGP